MKFPVSVFGHCLSKKRQKEKTGGEEDGGEREREKEEVAGDG